MNIGVLTRSVDGWASTRLIKAIKSLGHEPFPFKFNQILIHISNGVERIFVDEYDLASFLDAVIVRPIGRSSLDQAIFRLALLYSLEDLGVKVVNPPECIEKAVDKYRTLHILMRSGFQVPDTLISENSLLMLRNLDKLGNEIVIKPIFGSRGLGSTKLNDRDIIWRVARSLSYFRNILYFQRFIYHGGKDIRAFVVGDRVIAAMYRVNPRSWKTNVARGARPEPLKPSEELSELAVKAAKLLGCEYAGVDFIESKNGYILLEVNSQPTWKGLQIVTKVNIAKEIVKHVISLVKK